MNGVHTMKSKEPSDMKEGMNEADFFEVEDLELKGYDKQIPPKLNEPFTWNGNTIQLNHRVIVKVLVYIRRVRGIDEVDEVS